MISIKSKNEIEYMLHAGKITKAVLSLLEKAISPGITTKELDRIAYTYITQNGSTPSFKGYNGFPASICTSVNDQVIHGIPGVTKLKEGDIISIDIGACYNGYHADCARTFGVGSISEDAKHLIDVTRQSFFEGIKCARPGERLSNISAAIQSYVEDNGYSVVRDFVGHGIGSRLHEEPSIPNFGKAGHGPRLYKGMTLAIEPMVNAGIEAIKVLEDGWTVLTKDGALSAHYENTVLITDGEPFMITE